ncbi:notch-regulated ankyrin repeat-containing protein B isoform X1 [Folsomia candida]|uniref:Notch-regulated ankyrin repeat-containing protein B n=1 Tax=Folsomia candida TaxID=158441 RepID=A0A226EIN2_FOLCA|nr:notch-regulated ankyrin repeat-containing protein B isoform X1 [Folsomia candida]OXA57535.1 Notch-regulated ankyrin repeat-containing protein B [Folsomia candida]
MKISTNSGGTDVQQSTAHHFHQALEQNNPSLLPEILKNRHIDCMDKDGFTLLHRSVLAERIEFVDRLISLGASATLATRDGWSPFHLAAFTGNSDILILLLKSSSGHDNS